MGKSAGALAGAVNAAGHYDKQHASQLGRLLIGRLLGVIYARHSSNI